MAIQMRRGAITNLDRTKLLPGEWAICTDGTIVICYASGKTVDVVTKSNMEKHVLKIENSGNDVYKIYYSDNSTEELTIKSGVEVDKTLTVSGKAADAKATGDAIAAITPAKIGAESSGTASSKVSEHNTSKTAHDDIRSLITGLTTRLNALADSDDTTLDQLSEIVAYIKNNKSLIDSITTGKVNVSDIIDNLTTNVANKPLSAAQGVALKALIDAITIPEKLPNPYSLTFTGAVSGTYDGSKTVIINIPSGGTGDSVDSSHYYVTPEQFGAIGDGTNNDIVCDSFSGFMLNTPSSGIINGNYINYVRQD